MNYINLQKFMTEHKTWTMPLVG